MVYGVHPICVFSVEAEELVGAEEARAALGEGAYDDAEHPRFIALIGYPLPCADGFRCSTEPAKSLREFGLGLAESELM